MSYNSKYTGKEVEESLDKVKSLNISAVDADEEVDEPTLDYVTKSELDNAIEQAITTTLNTSV